VRNNVGTYELPPQPPHLIRARSSYAGLYKAGCLRRRRSAIIIIMPLSLHCGGKRWGSCEDGDEGQRWKPMSN